MSNAKNIALDIAEAKPYYSFNICTIIHETLYL
jgi:hypothetical protein